MEGQSEAIPDRIRFPSDFHADALKAEGSDWLERDVLVDHNSLYTGGNTTLNSQLGDQSLHNRNTSNIQTDSRALERALWWPWEQYRPAGPAIYVSCTYNKGRSGHELKDVASVYLLAVWFGWSPCNWMSWWATKPVRMFNPGYALPVCDGTAASLNATSVIRVNLLKTNYDGLVLEDIYSLQRRVAATISEIANKSGVVVLVVLQKSTRVQIDHVYNWEREGRLPHPVFEPVRKALQARFFKGLNAARAAAVGGHGLPAPPALPYLRYGSDCLNEDNGRIGFGSVLPCIGEASLRNSTSRITVAAHFRRGDISDAMAWGEYSNSAFAVRLAKQIRAALVGCKQEVNVAFYTESKGAADLKKAGIEGAVLSSDGSWQHDMTAFINSDILVMANSSMSTWAGLFSAGLIAMPGGTIKHFRFSPLPPHVFPILAELEIPEGWLVAKGCQHPNGSDPMANQMKVAAVQQGWNMMK